MNEKVVAMILAGGKGTRLQGLTRLTAKPAVSFAAKYRIIDFPLSNCVNSGISNVGVCVQYESADLDNYLGDGSKWGLNGIHAKMTTLAPRVKEKSASWYKGTADAIAQNLDYIDSLDDITKEAILSARELIFVHGMKGLESLKIYFSTYQPEENSSNRTRPNSPR